MAEESRVCWMSFLLLVVVVTAYVFSIKLNFISFKYIYTLCIEPAILMAQACSYEKKA